MTTRFWPWPIARGGAAGVALSVLILCLAVDVPIAAGAAAENSEITRRRAIQRKVFTDAEITDGFFKLVFGAEFSSGGRPEGVRRYEDPVRVYIDNRARPDRTAQVVRALADIRQHVQNLDIAATTNRAEANATVTMVYDRDLGRTIRRVYGSDQGRRIRRSLDPQCLSGFRRDDSMRIVQSEVILVSDVDPFVFASCLYEEMLQALGPINDDSSVPWSMFNDEVELGFFGIYDQYLLNLLYHPRIRPGMSRDAVRAVLPEVMPEVRAFVVRTNKLPN